MGGDIRTEMAIRINELARELEVKSKVIIDYLQEMGVMDKRSHSSALEDDLADKVRLHFRSGGEEKPAAEVPVAVPTPSVSASISAVASSAAHGLRPPLPVLPDIGPLRRSIAEIKASARKAVAPPPSPVTARAPVPAKVGAVPRVVKRTVPVRPGIVPPELVYPVERALEKTAIPAAGAVGIPAFPASARPTGMKPAAPRALRTPAVRHAPGALHPGAAKAPEVPGARAAGEAVAPVRLPEAPPPHKLARGVRARKSEAFSQPIYPPAATQRGVLPRVHPVRRPGEPRPMHPTASRLAGATGGVLVGGMPAARPPVSPLPMAPRVAPPPPRPVVPEEIIITRTITVGEGITVKELSEKLQVRARDVIKRLLDKGVFATINQTLDATTAKEISRLFGADMEFMSFEEEVMKEVIEADQAADLVARPPVVTVMGHVDHGKTSLLDAIRETNVAGKEVGGITQRIGAYQVEVQGRKVTFVDTPGHEAFTRMRARGAKVTDIVVLVVAADDGVMPQTLEAVNHARAAKVPIVVAINKIDKPDAQIERVKRQLADHGLMPEEWGGDTVTVEVSAKQRQNLNLLLEMILLVADLKGLKANPKRLASGVVMEAKLDRGRGPVANVLVERGTLHVGDPFIVGAIYGKVRAMFNDRGQPCLEATPATPVEVLGLEDVPQAGDLLQAIEDTLKARQVALNRQIKLRDVAMAKLKGARLTLEQLHEQMAAGDVKELPLIIKADVQGSVEVLSDTLSKLSNERVKIKIIHAGVGALTETDVLLASASNAVIIGFSVRPERKATELAQLEQVDIRLHNIIYNVTDEIKQAMQGLLAVTYKEVSLGRAEVRDTFRVTKVGTVAGCYVAEGKIAREAKIRLLRDNVVVYEGRVRSLRRFKDDVPEVKLGMECGLALENFNDVKIGDVIEAFVTERVAEPAFA
jgi:translation initiation factor IF-2